MTSWTETSSYPFSWPSSGTLWACGDGLWLSIKSVPILIISIILGLEKKTLESCGVGVKGILSSSPNLQNYEQFF